MMNFLFGVLCAGGAVFGALLTFNGILDHSYEGIMAGGLFMFGSLLTFGIGQITRSLGIWQKHWQKQIRQMKSMADMPRTESARGPAPPPRAEPAVFPSAGPTGSVEPIIPQPVLEQVASRFARPGR